MTKYDIPIVGVPIDTNDYAESGKNIGLGVILVAVTLVIVGAGSALVNRGQDILGISDEQTQIPGV